VIPAGLFLADTSAISRVSNPDVLEELTRLGRLRLLATCATVDLEVLYSARSPSEYTEIARRRSEGFTDLPLTPGIGERAKAVQLQLSRSSQHRPAGVIDLLTAATAEHYGATVLHYDADFDHIAGVTRQGTRWVVPRGTVS
jgi:predicted nucleic acid-binding protein